MTLLQFRDLLKTVTPNVYHYISEQQPEVFIRWHESGGTSQYGSNQKQLIVRSIQVDLFTKTEYDPLLDTLLQTLKAGGVAYDVPLTDFEEETKYIHHIINCEVVDVG